MGQGNKTGENLVDRKLQNDNYEFSKAKLKWRNKNEKWTSIISEKVGTIINNINIGKQPQSGVACKVKFDFKIWGNKTILRK